MDDSGESSGMATGSSLAAPGSLWVAV